VSLIATGIDVGFDGGIVTVENGHRVLQREIPETVVRQRRGKKRRDYLESRLVFQIARAVDLGSRLFILEGQQVMGQDGRLATFSLGLGFGLYRGILAQIPDVEFQIWYPREWQKKMLAGVPGKTSKERSIKSIQMRLPEMDLLRTPRCRKPHDGLADAANMAILGCRILAATE
jgi:hypothetical protein